MTNKSRDELEVDVADLVGGEGGEGGVSGGVADEGQQRHHGSREVRGELREHVCPPDVQPVLFLNSLIMKEEEKKRGERFLK